MAFNIGFQSIQKLNIKNIHGLCDQSANEIMTRKFDILPKIERKERYLLIQSCLGSLELKTDKIETKGTVFGSISSDKALEVSNRLCVPKHKDESAILKARKRVHNKLENPKKKEVKPVVKDPNEVAETVEMPTYEDQRKHVERVNTPTVTSKIRLKLLRTGKGNEDLNINDCCERSVLQASQRYFPGAYQRWLAVDNLKGGKTHFKDYMKQQGIDPKTCLKITIENYTRQHRNNCKCVKYNQV